MATLKKKQTIGNKDSALEQLRDLGTDVVKSTQSDLVAGVAGGILNDLFAPKSQDLKPNQEVFVSSETTLRPRQPEGQRPEFVLFTAQEANLAHEVEAVRTELKRTVEELKALNTAVIEVEKAVALTPVKTGKYHLSFFGKLRAILRLFRQQVSESRVWLEETFVKKRKKQYWSMFKKHGTTFGLSSERALASQAG